MALMLWLPFELFYYYSQKQGSWLDTSYSVSQLMSGHTIGPPPPPDSLREVTYTVVSSALSHVVESGSLWPHGGTVGLLVAIFVL